MLLPSQVLNNAVEKKNELQSNTTQKFKQRNHSENPNNYQRNPEFLRSNLIDKLTF